MQERLSNDEAADRSNSSNVSGDRALAMYLWKMHSTSRLALQLLAECEVNSGGNGDHYRLSFPTHDAKFEVHVLQFLLDCTRHSSESRHTILIHGILHFLRILKRAARSDATVDHTAASIVLQLLELSLNCAGLQHFGEHTLALVEAVASVLCCSCKTTEPAADAAATSRTYNAGQVGACAQILVLLIEHSQRSLFGGGGGGGSAADTTAHEPVATEEAAPKRLPSAVVALRPGADGVVRELHKCIRQTIALGGLERNIKLDLNLAVTRCISLVVSLLHADTSYYAKLKVGGATLPSASCCCLSLRSNEDLKLVTALLQQTSTVQAITCLWLAMSMRARRVHRKTSISNTVSPPALLPQLHLQLQNLVMLSNAHHIRAFVSLAAVSCLEELYSPAGSDVALTATLVQGWAAHVARVSRDLLIGKMARTIQQAAAATATATGGEGGDGDSLSEGVGAVSADEARTVRAASLWSNAIVASSARSAERCAIAPAVALAVDAGDATLSRYLTAIFQRWPLFGKKLFEPLDGSHMIRYLTLLPCEVSLSFAGLVQAFLDNDLIPPTDVQESKAFIRACGAQIQQRQQIQQQSNVGKVGRVQLSQTARGTQTQTHHHHHHNHHHQQQQQQQNLDMSFTTLIFPKAPFDLHGVPLPMA